MIEFLFQRIKNNRWLYVLLLFGAILAVAIFSSIPMYSNAMLQRMLIKDLEIQQQATDIHSGQFKVSKKYLKLSTQDMIPSYEAAVYDRLFDLNKTPYLLESKSQTSNFFQLHTLDSNLIHDHVSFGTVSDIESHIALRSGRLPEENKDLLEVLMTDTAMSTFDMILDGEYQLIFGNKGVTKIKVVGVYSLDDDRDYYWGDGQLGAMDEVMTLLPSQFEGMNASYDAFYITEIVWRRFYDYHEIEIADVEGIIDTSYIQEKNLAQMGDGFEMTYDLAKTLNSYAMRESILRLTLWVLTVPVLIITCFYTYMISMLIIRNDENEISMLKSRGAGTHQIFAMYVVQSTVMALMAWFIGPWLGYLICHIIGASNGFLEFVSRTPLPVEVNGEVLIYAMVAAIFFMMFMLVPSYRACKVSIVQYKRKKNLDISRTFWERAYLDVVIILISGYGYYMFLNTGAIIQDGSEAISQTDPMLFLVPTLFVLGFGLLSVRLYPYLLKFIYYIGKKRWRPVMYYSLLNASRSERTSKFISLFIVLFLAFGLLNASQARTLNQNATDQVSYAYASDIQVQAYIPEREVNAYWSEFIETFSMPSSNNVVIEDKVPFEVYKALDGIELATKVLKHDDVFLKSSVANIHDLNMLAIVPFEFGQITWMREDLLPHHFNEYMNIMTKYPTAMFLSKDLANEDTLKVGDTIELFWDKYSITGVVYGFIDYFPSYNPYSGEDGRLENIVIANFDYIENRLPVQKYEIWMSKEEGVNDQTILNNLAEKDLETERVQYLDQALTQKRNDPMLQGTNGVLTMSYVIMLLITMMGYLIFWILNVRSRALKFGIFRAMGMSNTQVTAIIVTEQLIMIMGSLVAGLTIGTFASRIFVPMLQKFDVASASIPPFRVVILQGDYWRIIGLTLAMLLLVLVILNNMVKRFKVNQVIKLGED